MKSRSSSDSLQGETRRRANNTIRGFLYQFWRTVEVWIELKPEELLFVEGAEDFDRINQNQATAVQVKDDKASGRLTLGSADALAALDNFWKVKRDNPGRQIRFQFITTAESGSEKSGFFGEKGIEVWNLCRQSPLSTCSGGVERIKDFLLKKSLDSDLAKFLKDASAEDIQQKFIMPLEWLCHQPSLNDMNEIVIGRLLKMGKEQGLTAKDAVGLAERLCMRVAKAACAKSPERLTLIDFMEQFDSAVNVEVPREALRRSEEYTELFDRIVKASLETGEGELPKVTKVVDAFTAPVLGTNIWARKDLIECVRSALSAGVAYIHGSTGMGKTTLVRQALDGEKPLLWAGLRDYTTREIVETCRTLVQHVTSTSVSPVIVLDDLNSENDDPRSMENDLGRLASVMKNQQGSLIIISYRPAGPRLASVLGLSNEAQINVPAFEEEEVRDFLITAGCNDQRARELGRVVWLLTSGHPQLVCVRVNALKTMSFPKPTLDDIIDQPRDIRDARMEALHALRSVLPEGARNLLYRLSLAIPQLKRSHALRIGAADPAIPQAGEMFDHLVGPWMEQPTHGRFRVSALVSKAGDNVLAQEEVKRLHGDIARALLAEKTMEVNEFSGIVVHALAGGAETQLAIATTVFLTATKEIKEALAEELSWVAATGVDPSTHLPVSNKVVRQFFRLFQWEVASIAAPDYLEPLAKVMGDDFAGELSDLGQVLSKILYLSKLLLELDFPLSPNGIVAYTLELWRLIEWANSQGTSLNIEDKISPTFSSMQGSLLSNLFAAVLVPRLRTVQDLRALVSSLDDLDETDRQRLLESFNTDDGMLRILFNGPWLSIKHDGEGSYEEYAKALNEALSAGRRWHHHPWMRAAARTLSAILDEVLDRRTDAEQIVTETGKEVGLSLNLDEQLAVIALNHKEYSKALDIWRRVLPKWKSDKTHNDTQPLFGTRLAAISSANIGQWDLAAEFFGQAIRRAADFDMRAWKVGLLGDRGYALWKSGKYKQAAIVFSEAVEALEKLPNKPESFSEYAVQKLVGHTLAFLAVPEGALTTPVPGMCSYLQPAEEIKELPPLPTIYVWFFMYRLARQAGEDKLAARYVKKLKKAPFAFLRGMAAGDALERCLKSRNLKGVVQLATIMALELGKAHQRIDVPIYEPDPPNLTVQLTEESTNAVILPALCAGIMRARVLKRNIKKLVAVWQSESNPAEPYVSDKITLCCDYSEMSVGGLAAILTNSQETFERRYLASAFLLGREDTSPMEALYAPARFIDNAKEYEPIWGGSAGDSFDTLVRRDWLRLSNNRFLLCDPNLHVDAIRKACKSANRGWPAAAKIILTASPTVKLNFSESLMQKIKQLADAK